jgi:hypothetical protein
MAFTFTNYAGIEPQHSPLNDFIGKMLSGYNDTTNSRYLRPSLQEALKKQQLANQYYGPNMESQLALRNAQTGESGARTGLLGAQTQGARIENQWLPSKMQAMIAESQANAQKANLLTKIREQLLGNGQINQSEMGTSFNQSPLSSEGVFPPALGRAQSASNQKAGLGYAQAATAMQLLGLGKPEIADVNGKHIAITPFGNIDTGVNGLNTEEKALQSGLGKYAAKLYGDATDSYKAYQNQGVALDELIDAVDNNPQFRNVTGRIKQPLTNWFGSPQQKELLGRLQSSSGEIALQVSPILKGSFTGQHQAIINSIKASPNDFPDVFIGKLKAQKLVNTILEKRSELLASYIEGGMKPIEASRLAAKNIPIEPYRQRIEELIKPKKILSPDELTGAKAELQRRGIK